MDGERGKMTLLLTETGFRKSNLGLRKAVVDAVNWANSEYGRVIVLEDDVRAGPQMIDFFKLFNSNACIVVKRK